MSQKIKVTIEVEPGKTVIIKPFGLELAEKPDEVVHPEATGSVSTSTHGGDADYAWTL